MEYTIKRRKETFGPYTEPELRAYLASGNIVPSDMVTGPGIEKPTPLRKLLEQWSKTNTLMTGLRRDIPSPPDMPWWLAAILDILTGLTFFVAWDIVEAIWLRRVRPQSRAIWYYMIAGILVVLNAKALYGDVMRVFGPSHPHVEQAHAAALGITAFVMRIVARFSMRRSLCEHYNQTEPIGLKLSWFWTLLFGGLYFQYHFNRINEARRLLSPNAA